MPQFTAFIPGVGKVRKSSSVTLTHAWAVQYKRLCGAKARITGWSTSQALAARFAQAARSHLADTNPAAEVTDVNVVAATEVVPRKLTEGEQNAVDTNSPFTL